MNGQILCFGMFSYNCSISVIAAVVLGQLQVTPISWPNNNSTVMPNGWGNYISIKKIPHTYICTHIEWRREILKRLLIFVSCGRGRGFVPHCGTNYLKKYTLVSFFRASVMVRIVNILQPFRNLNINFPFLPIYLH